jgi:formate/nitrite transporter FocA (FNT family)
MEDWGESEGAHLAVLHAKNDRHKSERRFQLWVVAIFSAFVVALVILQELNATIGAKDIILVALPVFTFVLGKLDQKDG